MYFTSIKKKRKRGQPSSPCQTSAQLPCMPPRSPSRLPCLFSRGAPAFFNAPRTVLRVGPWCDFRGCRTGWFPPHPFIPASNRRGPVGEAPHRSSGQVPSGQLRPAPRKRVDLPSTSLWLAGPAPRGEGRGPLRERALRDQAAAGGLLWTGKVHGYRRQGLGSRLLCCVTLLKSLSVSGP